MLGESRRSDGDVARTSADQVKLRLRSQGSSTLTSQQTDRQGVPKSRKVPIVVGAGGVLAAGLMTASFLAQKSEDGAPAQVLQQSTSETAPEPRKTFFYDDLGFSIEFNQKLNSEPLTESDKTDGFIARFTAFDPPIIISVRHESGLRTVATLAGTDTATLLRSNIDRSLPARYPQFDQQTGTTITINEKTVIDRVFTYAGPSGEAAKQRLLAFIKDDDTAVYVSMPTTAALYDTVSVEYFDSSAASISIE